MSALIEDDLLPGMTATIGAAVTAARNVGRPDPSDDDLYLRLVDARFTAKQIVDWFERAKAGALATRD
jgi:hypothetical protein